MSLLDAMKDMAVEAKVIAERATKKGDNPATVRINAKTAVRLAKSYVELVESAAWLLDDMSDAGEDKNQETGDEYDSVTGLREAVERAKE